MKSIFIATLILSAGCFSPLRTQQVDVFLGIGTARAGSNGGSYDTLGDGNRYSAPSMNGVFPNFGLSVFLNKSLGLGWTAAWRGYDDYAGLQYRPVFHTFDAIFSPTRLRAKRFASEFRGGIGLVNIHYDLGDQGTCDSVPGCDSSNYFLGHFGAAARFYMTNHIFVRPAVDVHYIHDFHPFGTNWVPRYSIIFGYSFGNE